MANLSARLADNVPGEFYVDATCIDCDTCRRVAPAVFEEGDGHSFVGAQPRSAEERRRAFMALVACPTASIGTSPKADASEGARAFPEPIHDNVSFCGFTSESSFGAWSYLIERAGHSAGNVLVDSPRAAGPLLSALEARGGVATMFLTHRDDVADHAAFRKRFGCERVLHEDDVTASTRDVERRIVGLEPVQLAEDLLAIPTPGHTRGHAVLLYRERVSLHRRPPRLVPPPRTPRRPSATPTGTPGPRPIRSMERLLDYSFEWVLPGHGERYRAESPGAMRRELERCIAWMKER